MKRSGGNDRIVLTGDGGEATLLPRAGASLRSIRARTDRGIFELLAGAEGPFEPDRLTSGAGSFLMAPWPNRIRGGRLVVDGRTHRLPVNSGVHAIHGTVRGQAFDVVELTDNSCRLECPLGPDWPFPGCLVYEAAMEGSGLLQRMEVHSGAVQFPAGVGWHPWFRRSIGGDGVITAPVTAVWELDREMTPSGKTTSPAGAAGFRNGVTPEVGSLDHCFSIEPGMPLTVAWPDLTLTIASSPEVSHLQVYSPEGAFCIEPQTCCVDAFRLAAEGVAGTGTAFASPGAPVTAWTRWSWA